VTKDATGVGLSGKSVASPVYDVIFTGSDRRLEVATVDLGAGSLLRRMGFRRLGERISPAMVDWAELHLTSPRRTWSSFGTAPTALHRGSTRPC
jgi:hypothetical protein